MILDRKSICLLVIINTGRKAIRLPHLPRTSLSTSISTLPTSSPLSTPFPVALVPTVRSSGPDLLDTALERRTSSVSSSTPTMTETVGSSSMSTVPSRGSTANGVAGPDCRMCTSSLAIPAPSSVSTGLSWVRAPEMETSTAHPTVSSPAARQHLARTASSTLGSTESRSRTPARLRRPRLLVGKSVFVAIIRLFEGCLLYF